LVLVDATGPRRGFAELPEFLTRFDTRATTLKIGENAHENVTPALIGREAIEVEANKL